LVMIHAAGWTLGGGRADALSMVAHSARSPASVVSIASSSARTAGEASPCRKKPDEVPGLTLEALHFRRRVRPSVRHGLYTVEPNVRIVEATTQIDRGPHRRLYTITGWSETMNFVSDCEASAMSQTHSVQTTQCNCLSCNIRRRTVSRSFVPTRLLSHPSPSACAASECSCTRRRFGTRPG